MLSAVFNHNTMSDSLILTIESVRTRASTGEVLICFSLPLEEAAKASTFMSKIGHQVGAAFADIEDKVRCVSIKDADLYPTTKYGNEARALKLSGFFRVPEVWKVIGSDENFLNWIRCQPSAHSGDFGTYDNTGEEGRNEASHVRRVDLGSGTGIKPQYSAIPLTHSEHQLIHQKGESALHPPEWFEQKRIKYVESWGWEMLRNILHVDSMADADPKAVFQWANFHGVEKYLPKEYRDAANTV